MKRTHKFIYAAFLCCYIVSFLSNIYITLAYKNITAKGQGKWVHLTQGFSELLPRGALFKNTARCHQSVNYQRCNFKFVKNVDIQGFTTQCSSQVDTFFFGVIFRCRYVCFYISHCSLLRVEWLYDIHCFLTGKFIENCKFEQCFLQALVEILKAFLEKWL